MPQDPVKVIDLLGSAVAFFRDAGLFGEALLFILALYLGKLRWGRDYDKLEKTSKEAQADLEAATAHVAQLEQMVQHLSMLLERATGGYERTVVSRIAQDEGINYEDAMERMAKAYDEPPQNNNFPRRPYQRRPRAGRDQD